MKWKYVGLIVLAAAAISLAVYALLLPEQLMYEYKPWFR